MWWLNFQFAQKLISSAPVELYWMLELHWADSHSPQHELSSDIQLGFVSSSSLCCPGRQYHPLKFQTFPIAVKLTQDSVILSRCLRVSLPAFCLKSVELTAHIFNLNYFEKWSSPAVWIFWRFMVRLSKEFWWHCCCRIRWLVQNGRNSDCITEEIWRPQQVVYAVWWQLLLC